MVLLSEQDYPVCPLSELREHLTNSNVDAFILAERIDDVEDRRWIVRYLYQYVSLPCLTIQRRLPARWQTIITRWRRFFYDKINNAQPFIVLYMKPPDLGLPTGIGIRARKTPFSDTFPCWKNDCWCVLSKKTIVQVLQYLKDHPEFAQYYRRTMIPLESATATIVLNDPTLRVANTSLHLTRWNDSLSGRPDVFGIEDLDNILSTGAFFARKFEEDSEVLAELDKIIIGTDEGM